MKRRTVAGAAAAGLALTLGSFATPAAADPVGWCPDDFAPLPIAFAVDPKKDHNGNGFVCAKFSPDGKLVSGPDDRDDILVG
jgi:hypothetical protein